MEPLVLAFFASIVRLVDQLGWPSNPLGLAALPHLGFLVEYQRNRFTGYGFHGLWAMGACCGSELFAGDLSQVGVQKMG